jgi:hypothetical protein
MKPRQSFRLILHPSSFIPSDGGMLSVALSRSFFSRWGLNRTVGVTHHRVLWSPDFPLPEG